MGADCVGLIYSKCHTTEAGRLWLELKNEDDNYVRINLQV